MQFTTELVTSLPSIGLHPRVRLNRNGQANTNVGMSWGLWRSCAARTTMLHEPEPLTLHATVCSHDVLNLVSVDCIGPTHRRALWTRATKAPRVRGLQNLDC